jgi:hypothetical protein
VSGGHQTGRQAQAKSYPPTLLAYLHVAAYTKGPACKGKETENAMKMVLYLETSQPCGTVYRFGLGCFVPPELVSLALLLVRWF